jgi:DNA-binding CsgD family transcriptional regulator
MQSHTPGPPDRIGLTERQVQVLYWAAQGKTVWETAKIMDLAPFTIVNHRRNAMMKLQATNIAQAIAMAMASGVIPQPDQREDPAG